MSPFNLPEFIPGTNEDDRRLFVLVNLSAPQTCQKLAEKLHTQIPSLKINIGDDQRQMLLISAIHDDHGRLLGEIAAVIDQSNDENDNRPNAEIIETRLLSEQFQSPDALRFLSRHVGIAAVERGIQSQYRRSLVLASENVFGTGLHPSTKLAVQALDDLYDACGTMPAAVLDIGCGSGILALIAGRLGAREVFGIDVSEEAVRVADQNAIHNHLEEIIRFATKPAAELTGKFDLILANVTAAVMMHLFDDICRLAEDGYLVISGLLGRQGGEMAAKFNHRGFALQKGYRQGNWQAALLRNKGSDSTGDLGP